MDFCHGRCASEVGIEAFMQHPAVTNSASSFLVGKNFLQNFCEPKSANKQTLQINLQQARHFGRPRCSFHGRIWSPSLHQGLSGDSGFVCRGLREGSSGHSPSEEDDPDKDDDSTAPLADHKVPLGDKASHESDWRAFRASLVAGEQALAKESKLHNVSEPSLRGTTGTLGKTWAHPLVVPEAGCVLVATDKLDGQIDFERTVILLLRVGSNKPREGPFGVILNRPTLQTINKLEPENRTLADVFGNCPYFYGGPLESELFLLMQEGGSHKQFGEIIPGVSHVGLGGLQHAAHLLKDGAATVNDFRFYVGYAGWGFDQLMHEIASGYWHVAACNTTLLRLTSTDRLWQKVLRLMGGQYAELSRKPKNDIF
eukprot:c19684_g1_i2 orf=150-1259(-)